MLSDYIKTHYAEAVSTQNRLLREGDDVMIEMMNGQISFDSDRAKSWMQKYSLFQGIDGITRDRIVESVRTFIAESEGNTEYLDAVLSLNKSFYDIRNRVWLSASSKIAWCRWPNEIPIYDAFVFGTLTVLQRLEPCLKDRELLGPPPILAKKNTDPLQKINEFYRNYDAMINALLN